MANPSNLATTPKLVQPCKTSAAKGKHGLLGRPQPGAKRFRGRRGGRPRPTPSKDRSRQRLEAYQQRYQPPSATAPTASLHKLLESSGGPQRDRPTVVLGGGLTRCVPVDMVADYHRTLSASLAEAQENLEEQKLEEQKLEEQKKLQHQEMVLEYTPTVIGTRTNPKYASLPLVLRVDVRKGYDRTPQEAVVNQAIQQVHERVLQVAGPTVGQVLVYKRRKEAPDPSARHVTCLLYYDCRITVIEGAQLVHAVEELLRKQCGRGWKLHNLYFDDSARGGAWASVLALRPPGSLLWMRCWGCYWSGDTQCPQCHGSGRVMDTNAFALYQVWQGKHQAELTLDLASQLQITSLVTTKPPVVIPLTIRFSEPEIAAHRQSWRMGRGHEAFKKRNEPALKACLTTVPGDPYPLIEVLDKLIGPLRKELQRKKSFQPHAILGSHLSLPEKRKEALLGKLHKLSPFAGAQIDCIVHVSKHGALLSLCGTDKAYTYCPFLEYKHPEHRPRLLETRGNKVFLLCFHRDCVKRQQELSPNQLSWFGVLSACDDRRTATNIGRNAPQNKGKLVRLH